MIRYLPLFVLVASLAAPPFVSAAEKEDAKAELKKLQGTWQVIKWLEDSGEAARADEIKDFTFAFKDETLGMHHGKSGKKSAFKLSLNPSKKPKWIDIEMGDPVGTSEGIYKLDGDELTLCVVSGGKNGKLARGPRSSRRRRGSTTPSSC